MKWQLHLYSLARKMFDIETLHYIVKPVVKKQFYYMLDIFFDGYTSMRMLTVNGR